MPVENFIPGAVYLTSREISRSERIRVPSRFCPAPIRIRFSFSKTVAQNIVFDKNMFFIVRQHVPGHCTRQIELPRKSDKM